MQEFSQLAYALLRRLHFAGVDEAARLSAPQRCVVPVELEQSVVRALFYDMAMVEHDQPIHPGNGGEPMRDGDHGLAGHEGVEALLDGGLDFTVERGGGFVEHGVWGRS